MEQRLTSAQAAERLGVGASTIKRWAESGLIACERTAGRHRRFRLGEIERLRQHLRLRTARETAPPEPGVEILLDAYSPQQVRTWLVSQHASLGSWAPLADQIVHCLRQIGGMRERGILSSNLEHAACERLERALESCSAAYPVGPDAPRCLLASFEGDAHSLGLGLAEPVLRERGWSVERSGSLSLPALTERIARDGMDLLVLSASSTCSSAAELADRLEPLRKRCASSGTAIVLAGAGPWPAPPGADIVYVASYVELAEFLARSSHEQRGAGVG